MTTDQTDVPLETMIRVAGHPAETLPQARGVAAELSEARTTIGPAVPRLRGHLRLAVTGTQDRLARRVHGTRPAMVPLEALTLGRDILARPVQIGPGQWQADAVMVAIAPVPPAGVANVVAAGQALIAAAKVAVATGEAAGPLAIAPHRDAPHPIVVA